MDERIEESATLCVKDSKQVLKFLQLARALDDNIRPRINEHGPSHCLELVEGVVFPNWDNRMGMLSFCQRATERTVHLDDDVANFRALGEEQRNEMLRIDPYGYKGLLRRQLDYENQVKGLRWMYDREQKIDLVIRQRSAEVLKDICGIEVDKKYITAIREGDEN